MEELKMDLKPKKYRARVLKDFIPVGEEECTEIKEGYLNLVSITYKDGCDEPTYVWAFVEAAPYLDLCAFMGFGRSVYTPRSYGTFELLEEVED